jgi:hypothetical protein
MNEFEEKLMIRFEKNGQKLAEWAESYHSFVSLNQYGYVLEIGFKTLEKAEEYTLEFYRTRQYLLWE